MKKNKKLSGMQGRRIKNVLIHRMKMIAVANFMKTEDVIEAMIVYGLKHAYDALKEAKSK